MENAVKKKHRYIRFIYLAIAFLLNGFIIMQSCLPADASAKWSNFFVSVFANIFNSHSAPSAIVDGEGIDIKYTADYKYNHVPGYEDNEIIVGKTKYLEIDVLPASTTNNAVYYTSSNPEVMQIKQNGNKFYFTGLYCGSTVVKFTSATNPNIFREQRFDVVSKRAPTNYEGVNLKVNVDELFLIPIALPDEDFMSYYDLSLLKVTHDMGYVTRFDDQHFQINDLSIINFYIGDKVSTVTARNSLTPPDSKSCYVSGKVYLYPFQTCHYQVVADGPASDYLWEVDSPYATIDEDGNLTTYKVDEITETTVIARSCLFPSIIAKARLYIVPTFIKNIELMVENENFYVTDLYYLANTRQQLIVDILDDTGTIPYAGYSFSSSNEEVAKVYGQGESIHIDCLKEGRTTIRVTSTTSPDISAYIDLEVLSGGAINNGNYKSFTEFIRKSLGHFTLFLLSGVFSFLAVYHFLKNSSGYKKWQIIIIALCLGLIFASLSELIQFYIPSRFGSLLDVLVDFSGFVAGLALTVLIIYLWEKRKIKNNN